MTSDLRPAQVSALLRYLAPGEGRPVFYGRQVERNHLPLQTHQVDITDVRAAAPHHNLDVEGFQLLQHRTEVTDFLDAAQVDRRYRPEIEEVIRHTTGARSSLAIHGVVRRSDRSPGYGAPGTTVVGRFVHGDYAPEPCGSTEWLRRLLPQAEAERRQKQRFAIYTVWRVLTPPPQDMPLALCDSRSMNASDRVTGDGVSDSLGQPEKRYSLSLYRYNPAQRWCYFRDMNPDEMLIFKGYDSDSTRAGGVAHAAFDDPSWSGGGPPRESSDYRVIAFFED